MTAYDDRGDMDKVHLYANGTLVGTTEVFPFQFRYTPPTSTVGPDGHAAAEAVDKAGNKSTPDPPHPRRLGCGDSPAPVPVAPPTISGTPAVGSTLTCINGGFTGAPDDHHVSWLRNGVVIAGADDADVRAGHGRHRPRPSRAATRHQRAPARPAATSTPWSSPAAAIGQGPAGPAGPAGPGPARRAPPAPPAPPAPRVRRVPPAPPAPPVAAGVRPARRATRAIRATRPTSASPATCRPTARRSSARSRRSRRRARVGRSSPAPLRIAGSSKATTARPARARSR